MKYISMPGLIAVALLISASLIFGQPLEPGFDADEYRDMILISMKTNAISDSIANSYPEPEQFELEYISDSVGLDNLWELWTDGEETAVLSVRGSTPHLISWVANFHAAMIPAKGELKLEEDYTFEYDLADDPHAAVHVGWTISLGFLERDMRPKIDSLYAAGVRNFLLTGHSQGGAITYLLTAHMMKMRERGELPEDIHIKGYCSAAPKPGNLYFAYEFEHMTNHGWAFNVVNTADWVPETPVSIQTLRDFNETNPFVTAKKEIKKLKFPKDVALRYVYNNLDRPTRKAQKKYEKFLGKMIGEKLEKQMNGFDEPDFYKSNHYVRTGEMVVLYADEEYYKEYPKRNDDIWIHHRAPTYYKLFSRWYD